MTWCGQIIGSDKNWGTPGAPRMFIVGDTGVMAEAGSGPLLPETLVEDHDRLHLPALGALAADDRLALIGFQTLNPHWDGVAIVVGTQSTIWATLSAREVIHQQGSATPRMAAALGVADAGAEGFEAATDRPERLPLLLQDAVSPAAELGALLGAEIGATRTLWLGQQAVLIGAGPLTKGYAAALSDAHVPVTLTDRDALMSKGFDALGQAFSDEE